MKRFANGIPNFSNAGVTLDDKTQLNRRFCHSQFTPLRRSGVNWELD